MGLWVLLLIRCSTFTLLSDVGHLTNTEHDATKEQNQSFLQPNFVKHVIRVNLFVVENIIIPLFPNYSNARESYHLHKWMSK